ncbi:DUF2797 domain-containing protein [Arthrobacter sp. PM3]|uniref:DUF2797 domain-containing protein n=1 Tax=Arthrobacter sp. PM3 TaxID=2017685 RepID=UPI000E108746|nr:DUF2797 domain-containing protein [Arthrobacter sp. PM3]AXJ08343.1 hypothetical protein CFN17_00845 [Arthrobacter sp. PM3]
MTSTRYLVHGVFWDGPAPAPGESDGGRAVLRVQHLDPARPGATDGTAAFTDLTLDAGTRLGFRVAAGGKSCLGHHKVHGPADRDHVPCPARARTGRGNQCERCFVLDDSRLIHDFHRGGRVPPGLRAYLMQPHWLYIATFAGGATKVGTASQLRRWNRLAEQGAVVARYVARADDGRVVRILEDMITRDAGLPQQVRSAAKAAALAAPLPADGLDAHNRRLAGDARDLLSRIPAAGFTIVDEPWLRPGLSAGACLAGGGSARRARHPYPHELGAGEHGFVIASLSGSVAVAGLAGTDLEFVVNLGLLKARTIVPGEFGSAVPAVQESLF